MTLATTTIQDLVIINPAVFNDERGYFFEAYNQAKFHENGITYNFIQDNQSFLQRRIRGYIYKLTPLRKLN
jgi:dTDP-4-dehydrorhamnose 3,5-epimerase